MRRPSSAVGATPTVLPMPTPTDRAHMQLAQALTRTDDPVVAAHLRAAIAELDAHDDRLVECSACGRVGLTARMVCTHCAD